jgi:hypothetical protein
VLLTFKMTNRHSYNVKLEWRSGDAVALPVPGVWAISLPLCTALFRLMRITRFYMRKGLRVKRVEIKAPKNGPPASAFARVFPEEIKFAKAG